MESEVQRLVRQRKRLVAKRILSSHRKDPADVDINVAAGRLAGHLRRLLDDDHATSKRLAEFVKYRKHLSDDARVNLQQCLRDLIGYATDYESRLNREQNND